MANQATLLKLLKNFTAKYGLPDLVVRAPGRANIIGEHVDYCDGLVLPFAIEQSMYFVAKKKQGTVVNVNATDLNEQWSSNTQSGSWSNYINQVLLAIERRGLVIGGLDVHFSSDIPIGAGVSSSSALCCGFVFLLNALYSLGLEKQDLVNIASEAEHGLGLKGGKMDQYSIMYGQTGQALLLNCKDHSFEYIPINTEQFSFVLVNSGVKHELVHTEYNDRRVEVEAGLKILSAIHKSPLCYTQMSVRHLSLIKKSHPKLFLRLDHVRSEIRRTNNSITPIVLNYPILLGKMLLESHLSLKDNYKVSCPEVDFLVYNLNMLPHIYGARMMGGGFGGSVICLVDKGFELEGIATLRAAYYEKYGLEAEAFRVKPSDGVGVVH